MSESLLDIYSMRKRAKRDAGRHDERVKRAIKENLKDLVSDISIITSDGKKKVKVPLKYLDTYRFKHGENKNQENVGHGNKDGKPGDILGHDGKTGIKPGNKAGDKEGDEVYEEVEIDEIVNLMLEDLGLPWLESKDNAVEVETDNLVFNSIAEVGPLSSVDKKRTIIENMKRNAKNGKVEIKGILPEDMRYKVWEVKKEYHSNAAVYFLMDRSGSMDENRKYIARSFFFWLAHFCKSKYSNVELVFIAHTTTAKVVEEKDFFTISNSGGTKCSSAFQLALDNINKHHPPERYSNYVFEFSDGDNWGDDNKECARLVDKLLEVCSAVGYGEIDIESMFYGSAGSFGWSTLHDELSKKVDHPKFMTAKLSKKEDVYETLRKFLDKQLGE